MGALESYPGGGACGDAGSSPGRYGQRLAGLPDPVLPALGPQWAVSVRRAWFDDGTPLGSSDNDECQIDSISQSWAVISGGGDPMRARLAMAAVATRLVRRDAQVIQLLAPPFD